MTFQIEIKPEAIKDLQRLDRKIIKQIKEKLEQIKPNPARHLKWINRYNVFCLRVGDHRIFIDLDANKKLISILTIRHRNKAYRGWK
ncbi:MAG: type II toxin-antitoxin system RelE/ParE family toxin [Candidatus Altiarchaeota archaeon]